jgi:hypothetical protein
MLKIGLCSLAGRGKLINTYFRLPLNIRILFMRYSWLLLPLILLACNEPTETPAPGETAVNIVPLNDTSALELQGKYNTGQGMILKPSDFKFYISDLSVQAGDGTWKQLRDAYLYDLGAGQTGFKISIPAGSRKMRYGIGVPAGLNNGDPTVYPNSHPYSVAGSNGMHWNWNSGYKFIVFEGKMDTSATGTFTRSFSFHTGMDTLYRSVEINLPASVKTVTMTVDASKFFTGINLDTENQTHGGTQISLAKRFTDNFINALVHRLD